MVLEWLKGATGVFSAGDRGAARSPAQARPPARRVRIQEDAKAAAAARVTREKEKARKDTPRKKNQSRALHAATAAIAKDASRDRRLAQPPRTCPDSDAYSSRASATGLN